MTAEKEPISSRRLREAEKRAFTLSTAALVLTVTFKSTLLEGQTEASAPLLTAWIALSISVISHVVGLVIEAVGHHAREEEQPLERWIRGLKIVSLFTWGGFVFGLCALVAVGIRSL